MSQPAFFHADSQSVRFWVPVGAVLVGASIAKSVLHHRFRVVTSDDDALQLYRSNASQIDAVVRRRVAAGALEPVMLREFDLREPPAAAETP
jgi:hypothetical protein